MFYPTRSALFFVAMLASTGLFAAAAQQAQPQQAAATTQQPAGPTVTADMLTRAITAQRTAEVTSNRAREQRFTKARDEKRTQLTQATRNRDTAEARSKALNKQFDDNKVRIDDINEQLQVSQGNLGELFGVTRQVSGDVAGTLAASLTSTQIALAPGEEGRVELLRRLASAEALPDIKDLEGLWLSILDELKMSGEVVRYEAPILADDGITSTPRQVVRVGSFMASSNGEYLGYLTSVNQFFKLTRQPSSDLINVARNLQTATTGYTPAIVDPSSGALMAMYVDRPNFIERIQNGEAVVYVTVAVGIIGVAAALIQYIYLFITRMAVGNQLRNLANPKTNNPLGRLLLSASGKGNESAEVVELRISDSVLREMPRLERFQSFLRLAVSAGPLLGLIGTVIGMIITFESITASGSSDPKLMARGIGQAMIATVMGLGVAIPLLFLNTGLSALSRSLINLLEEQGTNLLARKLAEGSHAAAKKA
ncbi:MAG: MotA/TolQ/ExbB proton channel family protein [Pseudomonadales bacterium]|jgi:biopolymer transport protein ExbB|nr:MotA/TolQ/ExbB proton channel family protein [Pseudomonadales bacterium]